MEYNKTKARGYTLGHDTPANQHMKRVKEITSNVGLPFFSFAKRNQIQDFLCLYISFQTSVCFLQLKYREVYERNKAHINMAPDAHDIRAAKEAYKNISNVSLHWSALSICEVKSQASVSLFVFLLRIAWLQEEVRGHQEQVDLDCGQTWFCPLR